jgi:hypothetical protein
MRKKSAIQRLFLSVLLVAGLMSCLHSQNSATADIIADGDSKLAVEQRKYRLWLEGLTPFFASCFSPKRTDKVSDIEENITILREHQKQVSTSLRTIMLLAEDYGNKLYSAIPSKSSKNEFLTTWRTFTTNITLVYTIDSDIIGEMITSLTLLKNNRSKYFFTDGQIDTKDEVFREQIIKAFEKVDSDDLRSYQQQQRNQAILNCSKAIEIAKQF